MARRMHASYIECSSKEMRGVDEVFSMAVNTVVSVEEQGQYNNRQSYTTGGKPAAAGGGGGGGGKRIKKRTCKIL